VRSPRGGVWGRGRGDSRRGGQAHHRYWQWPVGPSMKVGEGASGYSQEVEGQHPPKMRKRVLRVLGREAGWAHTEGRRPGGSSTNKRAREVSKQCPKTIAIFKSKGDKSKKKGILRLKKGGIRMIVLQECACPRGRRGYSPGVNMGGRTDQGTNQPDG